MADGIATTAPHPLHDPADRVLVAELGAWELRQFRESDRRLPYFAQRGLAHVQLWHPEERISIVTPSRLTGGNFELWSGCGRTGVIERFAAPAWGGIELALCALGVRPPNRHEMRAVERWFVLPTESRAGRLLHSWWAVEAVR